MRRKLKERKSVFIYSNKRNEEMLVKEETESSTMCCVQRLWANSEIDLYVGSNKTFVYVDLFSSLTKVCRDKTETGKLGSMTI